MIEVGITGSIGSGKSSVTEYVRAKGYTVIDADELVRRVYEVEDFKKVMIRAFGTGIQSEETPGMLDKRKIFAIVFADDEKRKLLDQTVGPFFKRMLDQELKAHAQEQILFLDIPLLFEKNYQKYMDRIILVYCEDSVRFARASRRDHKSIEEIQSVDRAQMPQDQKRIASDYVIDNSGALEALYPQVDAILAQILEMNHE